MESEVHTKERPANLADYVCIQHLARVLPHLIDRYPSVPIDYHLVYHCRATGGSYTIRRYEYDVVEDVPFSNVQRTTKPQRTAWEIPLGLVWRLAGR